ncbi:RusA family crossover junction endodeoxyribonuclease [Clostridium sp. MSJ-4]|uniref:RusA family crossover junction endodeoxyribonuclease n=1 Tax=Clostridium simiarum TaxID=2841506 RepID=A0ABS6F356_9CLOT|nr:MULTISPECIES: RusA family crossover junction endodeoxyribonuclease [Clostridium]MBU5592934.1 RusA family crossover junction endodeoxyribonuclease [Clostridium simiarum]
MSCHYAKVIVKGSPISKSNFKLFNTQGRAILPYNSGKYHDRYALYEEEIAYAAMNQNPNITITESLIAVLKVYYKSSKRHPDTNNITKSIFDGIEKSGLIINDAQVRKLYIEEFYDPENPRFELELFSESHYDIGYKICKRKDPLSPIEYSPPSNKKSTHSLSLNSKASKVKSGKLCDICGKALGENEGVSANKGNTFICTTCFKKLF